MMYLYIWIKWNICVYIQIQLYQNNPIPSPPVKSNFNISILYPRIQFLSLDTYPTPKYQFLFLNSDSQIQFLFLETIPIPRTTSFSQKHFLFLDTFPDTVPIPRNSQNFQLNSQIQFLFLDTVHIQDTVSNTRYSSYSQIQFLFLEPVLIPRYSSYS